MQKQNVVALWIKTPHETSVTLHKTFWCAQQAIKSFLQSEWVAANQSQQGGDVVTLEQAQAISLDDLIEYFQGEIEFEMFDTPAI